MCNKNSKNLFMGMLLGVATGAIGCCIMKDQKKAKKKASKAIHAMGDLIDDIKYMLK